MFYGFNIEVKGISVVVSFFCAVLCVCLAEGFDNLVESEGCVEDEYVEVFLLTALGGGVVGSIGFWAAAASVLLCFSWGGRGCGVRGGGVAFG